MLAIIAAASAYLHPFYDPQYHVLAFSRMGKGMCPTVGGEQAVFNLGDKKCYKLGGIMMLSQMITIDKSGDRKPEEIYVYSKGEWVRAK